jgi:hypothetical protein
MVETQERPSAASLDFYIQYEYLSSRDFGTLLEACSNLSDSAYRFYAESLRGTWADPPVLELSEANTGDSIKFKFIERALPSISSDKENDIVIGVPKKLGIPVLMGFLLLSAADKAMDMRNKYYDGQIKQIELQLKHEEINKIRGGGETKAPDELEKQSQTIIASLLSNSAFKEISINGVQIKGPQTTEPGPRRRHAG